MTDRYLFRGKRIDNGEWVEGVAFFKNEKCFIITDIFNCDEYQCKGAENYEVIPGTVGQCTGLKDKNGKLIFEGDVLRDKYTCEKFGYVGVVKYNVKLTQFQIISKFYPDYNVNVGNLRDSIRIIGNIHDNPELLEVKEWKLKKR